MLEKIVKDGVELRRWTRGPSSFLANVEEGARILNWNLTMGDGCIRDVLYWGENYPEGGEGFASAEGGMKIVFPFAKMGKGVDEGYANSGRFECEEENDVGFKARFVPSKDMADYPENFELKVSYRFDEFSLACSMRLENGGDKDVLWGGGARMFFALPWHDGLTRSSYRLFCDSKKAFESDVFGNLSDSVSLLEEDCERLSRLDKARVKLKTSMFRLGPRNGEEDLLVKINGGGKPEPGVCVVTSPNLGESSYCSVCALAALPNASAEAARKIPPRSSASFTAEISFA